MKRKLFWSAVFFSLGIGAQILNINNFAATAALFAFFALALAFYIINQKNAAMVFVLLSVLALGTLYFNFRAGFYYRVSESLHHKQADILGRVVDVKYRDYGSADIYVKTSSIQGEDIRDESKRKLLITVRNMGQDSGAFSYGDIVSCHAKLTKPSAPANIGDGDYGLYLMAKGINILGYADYSDVRTLGRDVNPFRPFDFARMAREKVKALVNRYVPGDGAALMSGLLIGDLEGMGSETKNAFKTCGLSHITAVSGMHLSIIIMLAMRLLGLFKMKMRPISVVFYIALVWGFVLVAGSSASIVRAALMTTLFLAGWLVNREPDGLTSLGFAVLVMLLINPASFFDVGLQLSAASTMAILVFEKPLGERFAVLPKALGEILSVTVAAYAGTVPIAAYHFGTVSVVGILANLIITPFVTLLTCMGIILIAVSGLSALGMAVGLVLGAMLGAVIFIVRILSHVPFASAYVARPDMWWFIIYALFAAAFYYVLCRQTKRGAAYSAFALTLIVFTLCINLFLNGAEIVFINVGNGDCALIKAPGCTVMIDSGGSETFDVAGKTIVPYLQREGVRQIDAALITHYHYDHCGAYLGLIERGFVKTLFLPKGITETDLYAELTNAAAKAGVRTAYISDMEAIEAGALQITAINAADNIDENNGMAYLMTFGRIRALFSGDITKDGEKILMGRGTDLSCHILKVPHHGSDTSSSGAFIDVVSPSLAVVTTGRNFYGHPSPEALKRYEQRGIGVLRSDINGTIIFNLTKKDVRLKTQRSMEYELR